MRAVKGAEALMGHIDGVRSWWQGANGVIAVRARGRAVTDACFLIGSHDFGAAYHCARSIHHRSGNARSAYLSGCKRGEQQEKKKKEERLRLLRQIDSRGSARALPRAR